MEFPTTRQVIGLTRRALPLLIGAAGGYAYYYFIGCVSGTCAITGNPWSSTGYGALLGFIATLGNKRPATKANHEGGTD